MAEPRDIDRILAANGLPPDIVTAFHEALFRRDHNGEAYVPDSVEWGRFFYVFDAFCQESDTFTSKARFEVVMTLLRAVFMYLRESRGPEED